MLNGDSVILEHVEHRTLHTPVKTYNFEVEGIHTYFVGHNSILVHNKCVEELFEGFEKHAFSKDHVKNGIENLGLSHRELFDSVYGDMLTKLDQAVEQSNQFYTMIGNTEMTVRFYVSNGEILSINAMVGRAERVIGKLLN